MNLEIALMDNSVKFGLVGLVATAITIFILRVFSTEDPGLYVAGTAIAWYATGLSFIRRQKISPHADVF